MRRVILATAITLVSTYALANTASFDINTSKLNSLGSAFKAKSASTQKLNPNDITMGYGGEDFSSKPPVKTTAIG